LAFYCGEFLLITFRVDGMKNLFFFLVIFLSFPILGLFEFDRALSYQETGDWQSSLSFLEKLLIDQPDNPLYLYHAGLAHYKLNNFESAQNYFEKFAHSVNQDDIESRIKGLFNQGNALYKSNKFKDAIAAYDAALLLDGQNTYVLANKKLAEEKLKQQNDQQSEQDQQQSQDDGQSNNQQSQQKKNNQSKSEKQKNQPQDPNQSNDANQGSDPEQKNDGDKNSDKNDQKQNTEKKDRGDNQKPAHDSGSDQETKNPEESNTQESEKSEKESESKGNTADDSSSKKEKNSQQSEDGATKERKKDSFNSEAKHNQPEPKQKNAMNSSIDEEKNQERVKKLQELEHANDGLVDNQSLLELLKDQEMQDQKDNKALMRALAKSKNALKVQENGW
jgi:Ca-activated chloride channel family protein